MTDLATALTEAAAAAIVTVRPSLEHEPNRLRGIVLELEIADGDQVAEGVCYVERRAKVRG